MEMIPVRRDGEESSDSGTNSRSSSPVQSCQDYFSSYHSAVSTPADSPLHNNGSGDNGAGSDGAGNNGARSNGAGSNGSSVAGSNGSNAAGNSGDGRNGDGNNGDGSNGSNGAGNNGSNGAGNNGTNDAGNNGNNGEGNNDAGNNGNNDAGKNGSNSEGNNGNNDADNNGNNDEGNNENNDAGNNGNNGEGNNGNDVEGNDGNNGEGNNDAGNNGAAPPSIWNEERWTQHFADLQVGAGIAASIPWGIVIFGLYGAKVFGSLETCNPKKEVTARAVFQGTMSVIFILSASFLAVPRLKLFVRGLSTHELARRRLQLNIGYLLTSLCLMVGVTFMCLAMLDFVEVRLGVWGCGSAYTQAVMVVLCGWVQLVDICLFRGIYHVFVTV